jgi:hypothetical protein
VTATKLAAWADKVAKRASYWVVQVLFGGGAFIAMTIIYYAWTRATDFPNGWAILFIGGALFQAVADAVRSTRDRRDGKDASFNEGFSEGVSEGKARAARFLNAVARDTEAYGEAHEDEAVRNFCERMAANTRLYADALQPEEPRK